MPTSSAKREKGYLNKSDLFGSEVVSPRLVLSIPTASVQLGQTSKLKQFVGFFSTLFLGAATAVSLKGAIQCRRI